MLLGNNRSCGCASLLVQAASDRKAGFGSANLNSEDEPNLALEVEWSP